MSPLRGGHGRRLAHLLLLLSFGFSLHTPLLVYGARESHLRIGKALNIFMRFGYLGISVHVIPYNDTTEEVRWLFREPTHNIYKVEFLPSSIFHLSYSLICNDNIEIMQLFAFPEHQ